MIILHNWVKLEMMCGHLIHGLLGGGTHYIAVQPGLTMNIMKIPPSELEKHTKYTSFFYEKL